MFETIIKQYVTISLNKPVTKEFVCGSLFVSDITPTEAAVVLNMLNDKVGNVQMSPIGNTGEFAYDFC